LGSLFKLCPDEGGLIICLRTVEVISLFLAVFVFKYLFLMLVSGGQITVVLVIWFSF
jgi:hypothetical protein